MKKEEEEVLHALKRVNKLEMRISQPMIEILAVC